MRLLINIPKEFEQHFQADRFEDSLHRLRADIHFMAGLYEQETAEMLIEAFKNAVLVPPHGRLKDADAFLAEQRHLYCENCGRRKGMKNGKMKFVYDIGDAPCRACGYGDVLDDIDDAPTIIDAEEGET